MHLAVISHFCHSGHRAYVSAWNPSVIAENPAQQIVQPDGRPVSAFSVWQVWPPVNLVVGLLCRSIKVYLIQYFVLSSIAVFRWVVVNTILTICKWRLPQLLFRCRVRSFLWGTLGCRYAAIWLFCGLTAGLLQLQAKNRTAMFRGVFRFER